MAKQSKKYCQKDVWDTFRYNNNTLEGNRTKAPRQKPPDKKPPNNDEK
jgi:hypothetical protein